MLVRELSELLDQKLDQLRQFVVYQNQSEDAALVLSIYFACLYQSIIMRIHRRAKKLVDHFKKIKQCDGFDNQDCSCTVI